MKMFFQTPADMSFGERGLMLTAGWPRLSFIEHRLEGDPTNWWAPNQSGLEAMLRSARMEVIQRPARETLICRPCPPAAPDRVFELQEQEYAAATYQAAAPEWP